MNGWDGSGWKARQDRDVALSDDNSARTSPTLPTFDELVQGPPGAVYADDAPPKHSRPERNDP